MLTVIKRMAAERLYCLATGLCHAIQAGKPNCKEMFIYVLGVFEGETNQTSCNTKDKLKAKITSAFTKLNKETTRKV